MRQHGMTGPERSGGSVTAEARPEGASRARAGPPRFNRGMMDSACVGADGDVVHPESDDRELRASRGPGLAPGFCLRRRDASFGRRPSSTWAGSRGHGGTCGPCVVLPAERIGIDSTLCRLRGDRGSGGAASPMATRRRASRSGRETPQVEEAAVGGKSLTPWLPQVGRQQGAPPPAPAAFSVRQLLGWRRTSRRRRARAS